MLVFLVCIGVGIYFFTSNSSKLGSHILAGSENRSDQANVNIKQKDVLVGLKHPVRKPSQVKDSFLLTADASKPVAINKTQVLAQADETAQLLDHTDESIELWVPKMTDDHVQNETIEHEEPITTNPEALANLQVGQVLEFFVPQLGEAFQSEIESTSNQLGDVKVWKGNIEGEGQEKSNFIMTQGEVMTNVVLATAEGVYTVHIDNETGEGTVVDDREYSSRINDNDDAVPYLHGSETD